MTIIMLALCSMLSGTYYAQNYASIIGWCLVFAVEWCTHTKKTKITNPAKFCLIVCMMIVAMFHVVKEVDGVGSGGWVHLFHQNSDARACTYFHQNV